MKRKKNEVVYKDLPAYAEPYDTENYYTLTLSVRIGFYGHTKEAAEVVRRATDALESTFDDVIISGSEPVTDPTPKAFVR